MLLPLFTAPLRQEQDVVYARQRTRQIAGSLGFDTVEQTRIATAVSEIARNAFSYAKDGKVEFSINSKLEPSQRLIIRVSDKGAGIADLQKIMNGEYVSKTGMGVGIIGSKRIVDRLAVESSPKGTVVIMEKFLPPGKVIQKADVDHLITALLQESAGASVNEIQQQNRELLMALQELERRQQKLNELNIELEETNRGVVALYAELDQRAEQLKLSDETKTRFLSYMSHEFRTPVNSVLNLSQFLLDRVDGDLTSEQEKQVVLIRKSMESLSQLVNDLLDLAKIQAGKIAIHPDETAVDTILTGLRGMFRPLAVNPEVVLKFSSMDSEAPVMYTDEAKVSQILRNFISNSLKFTLKGEIEVLSRFDSAANEMVFSVRDTGIGMQAADKERIFEEFNQIFHTLQKKVKGTGLGLPLSKRLAELLGGRITVDSEVGKGSTFTLHLPLVIPGFEAQLAASGGKIIQLPAKSKSFRALIIDDEEASYYALKRYLLDAGHEVSETDDSNAAIDIIKNDRPDIIFLDLNMPGTNGFDILTAIKRDPEIQHIPVAIHTSMTLSSEQRLALSKNAFDFIPKDMTTFSLKAFIESMSSRIGRRRSKNA